MRISQRSVGQITPRSLQNIPPMSQDALRKHVRRLADDVSVREESGLRWQAVSLW